ncbi:MAG: HlyD family efflux transporter periplasmic adaptor subunit, partial [Planctomycetota bacterium]
NDQRVIKYYRNTETLSNTMKTTVRPTEHEDLQLQVVDRSGTRPTKPELSRTQPKAAQWRKGAVIILLVLAVILIANRGSLLGWVNNPGEGWFAGSSRDLVQPNVPAEATSVFALGVLEPEGEVISVAAPSGAVDARIEKLFVKVGEQVRAGQTLAQLDNHDRLQAALKVAVAQVAQAESSLKQSRLVASTTRTELLASIASRQAQAKQAEVDMRRQSELLTSRAVSRQAYDDAALKLQTARLAVEELNARLVRYPEDVEQSPDVQVAASALQVSRFGLIEAEERLKQSLITAPIDGMILDVDLSVGEQIRNSPLLKLGRVDKMMARAEVYESDLKHIAQGQKARVHSDVLNEPLTGIVEVVGNYVQRQSLVDSSPAANTDSRVAEVYVRLSAQSSQVAARFVGMQVRVEFEH